MEQVNKDEIMLEVVQRVVSRSAEITINNENENEAAAEFLKSVKSGIKTVKDKFGPAVKAAHEAHKRLKALENECLDPLKKAETIIKAKMTEYHAEQERIRLEAQRKAEEIARKERGKLERKADKLREQGKHEQAMITETMQAAIVTAPPAASTSKPAGISYVDNWQAEIVNMAEVPREYMIPNMQALNALAKATKGSIVLPGVRFVNKKTMRARV